MKIAKVVGIPTSTIMTKESIGITLKLVLPLNPINMRSEGESIVCKDTIGTSVGDIVLLSNTKREAIDHQIIGLLNSLDIEGEEVYKGLRQ